MRPHLVIVTALALGLALPAWGAEEQPSQGRAPEIKARPKGQVERGWRDPLRYRDLLGGGIDRLRHVEFVEMFSAVVSGSQMGPGDGWFHPSESRYSWKWLAARYDADRDGRITRKEFTGPAELFDRLDRNRDGVLTRADFDWSERSQFAMQSMPSSFWFRMYDADSNGRITKKEWDDLFQKAAKGKGYLTADDLREAFPVVPPPRPPGPPPKGGGGPSMFVLVKGLFEGELGSPFPGPAVGQLAPDFTLRTQGGKDKITLSKYRGKPVVLVFGSFT